MCLAEFAACYYKDYKFPKDERTDTQPDVLTYIVAETQHMNTGTTTTFPDNIKLLDTNEVMKCRKVRAVVRFHVPNKRKEPEKFFHHLLMLYFPWRDELADLTGKDQTFASKLCEPEVQSFVEINNDAEAVEEALEFLRIITLISYTHLIL